MTTADEAQTWHFSTILDEKPFRIETITDPTDRRQVRELYEEIRSLYDEGEIDVLDTLLLYQAAYKLTGITPGTALGTAIPLEKIR